LKEKTNPRSGEEWQGRAGARIVVDGSGALAGADASATEPAFPDRALALADLDYWDSV
jgi:hypothetical protein